MFYRDFYQLRGLPQSNTNKCISLAVTRTNYFQLKRQFFTHFLQFWQKYRKNTPDSQKIYKMIFPFNNFADELTSSYMKKFRRKECAQRERRKERQKSQKREQMQKYILSFIFIWLIIIKFWTRGDFYNIHYKHYREIEQKKYNRERNFIPSYIYI